MEIEQSKYKRSQPSTSDKKTESEAMEYDSHDAHFTRSSAPLYVKSHCFFCDRAGTKRKQLHHVSLDSAGFILQEVVDLSGNDVWRVRLSEAIPPGDAHAMDVLYHAGCWATNISNIRRTVI